ncbi:MAG: hypothetical protein FI724_10490 [SAR202 cluster bacterium]|nr:hypothetical protein [SAR202 cluster bacterium]
MAPWPKLVFLMVFAVFIALLGIGTFSAAASPSLITTFSVSPKTALPNESVTLLGTGFTPSTTAGGGGAFGSHQITGNGNSVVVVGGTPLVSPNAVYPINFDIEGNWTASIIIPITATVLAGGTVIITVRDDQGLFKTTQVVISRPRLTLDPESSRINTELTVSGKDFPVSNPASATGNQVAISYAGTLVKLVPGDFSGDFTVTLPVPIGTATGSNNVVRAQVVGFEQSATAIHEVPAPTIVVSPINGVPGTVVGITGTGFPPNVLVTNTRANNTNVTSSPPPATDDDGKFLTFFSMPVFSPGVQTITATGGDVTAVAVFTVLEGEPVVQALPTPSPSSMPAEALKALTEGENLVRVWTFDNSSKTWEFFDPRPAFAHANTIETMVPGRIYWLRLNRVQSAPLNGKVVLLVAGWNLVRW